MFDPDPTLLAKVYAEEGSARGAALRFGVGKGAVLAALKRHGIHLLPRGQRPAPATTESLVDAYARLGSTVAVAQEMGISQSAAYRRLRTAGVVAAKGGRELLVDDSELLDAYERLESIRGVATELGIDFKTARKNLVLLGLITKGK